MQRWVAGSTGRAAVGVRAPGTPLARFAGGYLAAVCLLALLMWGFGDRWWPATVLLFMGRWIFLLPLAVLLPAALLSQRRLVVPLLLGALVVVGPLMGFRTGWRRLLPGAPGPRVRVVTLNAGGGEAIAPDLPILLERWKGDVIALQECGESLVAAARRMDGWYEHDTSGLCLLSRWPIRASSTMDRRALERVKQDAAGIGGAGYVARYDLATPHGPVNFATLHLETPRKGFEALASLDIGRLRENTELRDIESSVTRRWLWQAGAPLVVAGDFNMPVESRIFRHYWGDFDDAFSRAGVGLGATRYNGWIRVRIDHVLVDDAWRAERAVVGDEVASDHRPLLVDLTLVGRR